MGSRWHAIACVLLLGVAPAVTSARKTGGARRLSATASRASVANPFVGAALYVNPDYANEAATSLALVSGNSTQAAMIRAVQKLSTAVWLDRIDAIAGGALNGGRLGLTGHLDAALTQATAAGEPIVVPIVVYDLPGRDCAALASNGELNVTQLPTYKSQYIDAIRAAITSKAAYSALRIVAFVEPDSLPNMVTNLGVSACAAVNANNAYVGGVTYAIQTLGALPNVALYLDIGHSGWLGWPNNMAQAVTLYSNLITNAEAGRGTLVHGLATDIANYTPLLEPYLSNTNLTVLGDSFYQWNPCFDEHTYVSKLSAAFTAAGINGLGFVIDTSRNGWKAVNNGEPSDQRKARGNWCNVNGAGLGQRPQATPSTTLPIDAYMWVKPPGESDGSSGPTTAGNVPDAEGKRFDPNCSPTNPALDALDGAPPAGNWFHSDFLMLLNNAHPPLVTSPDVMAPPSLPASTPPPPKPTAKSPPPKPTAKLPPPKPTAKSPPPKATAKSPPPKPTAKSPPPKPTPAAAPTASPTASPTAVPAATPTAAPTAGSVGAAAIGAWGQCGGSSGDAASGGPFGDFAWTSQGGGACTPGNTCVRSSEWYWQCTPAPAGSPTAMPTATPTAAPVVTPTATPAVSPTAAPAVSPTAAPAAGSVGAAAITVYGQCGGKSGDAGTGSLGDSAWASSGGGACTPGNTCTRSNEWYWQCLPGGRR